MLSRPEKEYVLALAALRKKEYIAALTHFDKASPFFTGNPEFNLLHETTRTLVTVKAQLAEEEILVDIEEI